MLDDDAFDHVGDVFAPVGRFLEEIENLLPLHDLDGVALLFEQPPHRGLMQAIGLVLQPIDLDGRLGHALAPLQGLERLDHLVSRGLDDAPEVARVGPDVLDAVEANHGRRRIDRIHDVVERPRQVVDVLAIERGDEGLMQPLDDFVGDEVALVLDFLDLVRLVPDRPVGRQHVPEHRRAEPDLFRHRHEVVEEPRLAGNQPERHSRLRLRILADRHHI